jgi:hypothetical protein
MKFSFLNKAKKYIKLKLSYPGYKEVFKKIMAFEMIQLNNINKTKM